MKGYENANTVALKLWEGVYQADNAPPYIIDRHIYYNSVHKGESIMTMPNYELRVIAVSTGHFGGSPSLYTAGMAFVKTRATRLSLRGASRKCISRWECNMHPSP